MYVPDQYKTQEMCNKVILENDRMLRFTPDCFSNKKMNNKSVDTNRFAIQSFSGCCKLRNVW